MKNKLLKMLLIEDNPDDVALIARALRGDPCELTTAQSLSEAAKLLATGTFTVVLLDLSLPDAQGFETFARTRAMATHLPIIVLTGLDDEALGLRTVQEGAQDYLIKGRVEPALLVRAIRYAIERKRAEVEVQRYALQLQERNQRLREDLQMAREIQQAFLPQRCASIPCANGRELHVWHRYYPAGPVGGDFFDVVPLSDDRAGMLICDVMGHGVRAALVTAMLRTLVSEPGARALDPGQMLEHLSERLRGIFRHSDAPFFVSAFYLVADLKASQLRYASAGHPTPLLVRRARGEVEPLKPSNGGAEPALGLVDEPGYRTSTCEMGIGDVVLMFTDGLYEAEGPGNEPFGLARLYEAARACAAMPAELLCDELLASVQRFASGGFGDDVSLLAVDFDKEDHHVHRMQ